MIARRHRGFTLIELMVVIVILGILAGVLAVNLGDKAGKARHDLTQVRIEKLKMEVDLFKAQHARYPAGFDDLVANDQIDTAPRDAWGRPFLYRTPGERGARFDILSLGEDGQPGGEGTAADLSNHPPSRP